MAKISIKYEKDTSYGGIFYVMENLPFVLSDK